MDNRTASKIVTYYNKGITIEDISKKLNINKNVVTLIVAAVSKEKVTYG